MDDMPDSFREVLMNLRGTKRLVWIRNRANECYYANVTGVSQALVRIEARNPDGSQWAEILLPIDEIRRIDLLDLEEAPKLLKRCLEEPGDDAEARLYR